MTRSEPTPRTAAPHVQRSPRVVSTPRVAPGQPAHTTDLVIVANRLPVEAREHDDGTITWERSPGGLVTALESVMAGRQAHWVGWDGTTLASRPPQPANAATDLIAVPLSEDDVTRYYEGFCNSAIWPLYHDAVVPPVYHRPDFDAYVQVNRRFAELTAARAVHGAMVWVHDYQLQLVPRMLRAMRPDLRIGFFLHIPFPPTELFLQLPWRSQIIEGMLGADLVGFQRPEAARNFRSLAMRLAGATSDSDHSDENLLRVTDADQRHRQVRVDAFPISVDFAAWDRLARSRAVATRVTQIRADLGNPRLLLLGVDRLDYTKGIDVRLKAMIELMEEALIDPDEAVFVQIATPTRENVEQYQRIREQIELAVGRAVGGLGRVGASPVQYLHTSLPMKELAAFYRAADVMLVTPLRDGMNLVAKEYVASQVDESGALVLSEFTGAAAELTDAWLVNPHDADGVKHAILHAMRSPQTERTRRMHAMREHLRTHDVRQWAGSFLNALDSTTTIRSVPG